MLAPPPPSFLQPQARKKDKTMTTETVTTRTCYTVPAWAKDELGAAEARRLAWAAMVEAKRGGATFKEACAHIEDVLTEHADQKALNLLHKLRFA